MAIIILYLWSPSSKYRHDLHRHRHDTMISHHLDLYQHVVTWSSRQLLLLQILLSHSDKVKQLYGACILCNKETTRRLLPVADNFNKTWSSHTTIYISSRLDHISVTPPIWPYTNHARKCVRPRSGTHGKISQHNSKTKISHTSFIIQARGLEGSNTSARSQTSQRKQQYLSTDIS